MQKSSVIPSNIANKLSANTDQIDQRDGRSHRPVDSSLLYFLCFQSTQDP